MAQKDCFFGAVRRRTFICCRSTKISASIQSLYYPDSPYEFSVLPADILGQIYERFLGKTIKIERRHLEIDEKPEVKKAGGVYYPKRKTALFARLSLHQKIPFPARAETGSTTACWSLIRGAGPAFRLFRIEPEHLDARPAGCMRGTMRAIGSAG
jgi:hypothetical protein